MRALPKIPVLTSEVILANILRHCHLPVCMIEIELLKKRLAEANTEIESLRLRLSNVTLLLRKEMTESEKLLKPEYEKTVSNSAFNSN